MNKFIDILLINPPTPAPDEHSYYSKMSPPLGLCYLATILTNNKYRVKVIDMAVEDNPGQELIKILSDFCPKIVGITSTTQNYYVCLKIAQIAKKMLNAVKVIVGGSHATYEYEDMLKNSTIDAAALFEAEDTIIELANYYIRSEGGIDKIKGIAYRNDDNNIVKTENRLLKENLDIIPIPDRLFVNLEKYVRKGTIMSSRGCVKKCIFCVAGNYEGNYRSRSPGNVVEELNKMYSEHNIKYFYFIDNVFTADVERVYEICSLIRKSKMSLNFYCVARLDTICDELMKELKAAGCNRVEVGVESASQNIIDNLEKGISVDTVLKAADIALGHQIQPMFTFQVGHPSDTIASMKETIKLTKKVRNKGAGAYLSVMTPYPGTPVYKGRKMYGVEIHTKNWEDFRMTNPICCTKNYGLNDVRKLIYKEYKDMD